MKNILYKNVSINQRVMQMIDNSVENSKVFPSYVFAGSNRNAKLEMAKYFASILNCSNSDKPCGSCGNCKAINEGKFHSFKFISKDNDTDNDKKKKSISVDDIRELRMDILNGLYQGHLLVYIDHAEDLTPVALNGLLKILEDIPSNVLFVFDVANQYSVLPTIRSRSQMIIFGLVEEMDMSQELTEFISVDKFNDFIENNSVQELLLYIEANKFDRAEVKAFLIKLEAYYIEEFKSSYLNKFLHLSGIVRKYHLYLNRPVSVVNNLLLMFLEIKEYHG
jgi:DNA polymerase III gamma/tau subunit